MPAPSSIAATRVALTDRPARTLVMLHGIYGRGRNWQGIARALVEARPEYVCWLVDLPYHGDSGPSAHGETVAGLAEDVRDWMAAEEIVSDAILGHSYGGKVSLAIAAADPGSPLQVWVIDSTPETKVSSGSAWDMLTIVRRLPAKFAARADAIQGIVDGGFSLGVAQWMATNLTRADDGFVWRLDFDVMERLMHDFFTTDLWPVVEHPSPRHEIHFLKASQSSAMSAGAVARIERIGNGVHLHHREGGHWIHAESPQVVVDLLAERLVKA